MIPLIRSSCLNHLKTCASVILLCLIVTLLLAGCSQKKEEPYTRTESEIEFNRICEEEYDWNIHTKFVGNTFWVYHPYNEQIIKYTASRFLVPTSKFLVDFAEGQFSEDTFRLKYQITELSAVTENSGIATDLMLEAKEDYYNLVNVILRVFFNMQAKQQPEFYVIILADIYNGVELSYTIYHEDLKKTISQAIAGFDYSKRILQDFKGNMLIVGDEVGEHLDYEEIYFDDFLAKQIANRVRIEFTSPSFKPENSIEEEIFKIITYCLRTYEFRKLSRVILDDLAAEVQTIATQEALDDITLNAI